MEGGKVWFKKIFQKISAKNLYKEIRRGLIVRSSRTFGCFVKIISAWLLNGLLITPR